MGFNMPPDTSVTTRSISKNPSSNTKKPRKTQVEYDAVHATEDVKIMTSRTHLQSYISRNASKRVLKNVTNCLSVVGRPMFQLSTLINSHCVVYFM